MSAERERSGAPGLDAEAPGLDAAARETIRRATRSATASGRSRWIARWIEHATPEGGHATPEGGRTTEGAARLRALWRAAGAGDRFYWEHVESGHAFCAVGNADETESSGATRFRDVRAWLAERRTRIDFLGDPAPETAPLALGGFSFEEDGPTTGLWKAFPAARFVLPERIVEQRDGAIRELHVVRVEPGATSAQVEAALQASLAIVGDPVSGPATPAVSVSSHPFEPAPDGGPAWPVGPEYRVRADRSHEVFCAQVRDALAEIEAGRLQKVVLARSLRVDHEGEIDVAAFLERLRGLYPSCTLVAMGRGASVFLAATPETLVRVESGEVTTAALAGSAPRGRTPEEDDALGQALLESRKDRAEHDHVVRAIRDVLAGHCRSLEQPEAPRLRRLVGIQHLETTFRGQLAAGVVTPGATPTTDGPDAQPDVDVLALVEALHPTPAVGGVPTIAARRWLARVEGLDRGWYAAPIGWLDRAGGGEFRVALRSALIQGVAGTRPPGDPAAAEPAPPSCAWLFAGAGLVAGSEPERELAETRIKLRALLAPLTEI